MYLDVRNNNKVTIVKELSKSTVLVKAVSNSKRYIVEKSYLKEIKV